ncbi:MAG: xanthine dehydrogenase family protein molybdopterin-binding subunit, partial [Betaproteobacteria bacterium]|nr:xanthine dehydrogenase family protein molybdopterin-binding subunit [Betaproteobacteria bacterium]
MNAPEIQFDPESARFGSARSQKRLEDDRLLVGKGMFSDDRLFDREAALVVVRSPHAHARIKSVNLDAVRAAPGVLAAWTMAELAADGVKHIPVPALFKRADGQPLSAPPRTPLAGERALYVGHPVVAIVAATRMQAQDAAELAEIEYEDLPCVVDPREAVKEGAPQLWPEAPGNVAGETRYGKPEEAAAAFKRAAHVTEIELHNQRVIAVAMEPRCAIGVHEKGRTTVYTQSQQPTGARDALAAALGAKPAELRVVNGDIGGGFGMKTGATPEEALVAYAAKKLGRPVRWRGERSEEFLAAHMGRDMHFKAALALDKDGRILALRLHMLGNMGAVPVGSSAMIPLAMVAKVQTSVYRVPAADFHFQGVLTNTMATGAYRGAGRPEGNYLIERLVEKAGREMGIDPVEIRRRNLLQPGDLPHTTYAGETYDTGDFPRMLDGLLKVADWKGYDTRAAQSKKQGRLRGRGLAAYLEWTGALPTETVDIEVDAEGKVTVFSGTQAMGQGLETTYIQLI